MAARQLSEYLPTLKRLMAEGDQAKLRGDFAAANAAYTAASRLVA